VGHYFLHVLGTFSALSFLPSTFTPLAFALYTLLIAHQESKLNWSVHIWKCQNAALFSTGFVPFSTVSFAPSTCIVNGTSSNSINLVCPFSEIKKWALMSTALAFIWCFDFCYHNICSVFIVKITSREWHVCAVTLVPTRFTLLTFAYIHSYCYIKKLFKIRLSKFISVKMQQLFLQILWTFGALTLCLATLTLLAFALYTLILLHLVIL